MYGQSLDLRFDLEQMYSFEGIKNVLVINAVMFNELIHTVCLGLVWFAGALAFVAPFFMMR
ncbi:MAG: hypothetical protein GY868_17950 [Deltaproteobacteria bacterium]|nr:hypothetical protein [Deltaproteobacteria bacterium]